jgi:hypothetical protein
MAADDADGSERSALAVLGARANRLSTPPTMWIFPAFFLRESAVYSDSARPQGAVTRPKSSNTSDIPSDGNMSDGNMSGGVPDFSRPIQDDGGHLYLTTEKI